MHMIEPKLFAYQLSVFTMEIIMEHNESGDSAQCCFHSAEVQLAIVRNYADHRQSNPC